METSVAAADKLTTWLKIFLYWAAIPLALLAILLGIFGVRTYDDFASKVTTAEKQVEAVSATAQKTAESARQKATEVSNSLGNLQREIASSQRAVSELQRIAGDIKKQYGQLQSDVGRYREVNQKIEDVQKRLMEVHSEVVNLGNRTLIAGQIKTTGPGPAGFSFEAIGCPSTLEAGSKVVYCTQESPSFPMMFFSQRTASGDLRPVASASPVGFQDVSSTPKPACTTASRGTFYVEKGIGTVADKPFLCAKKADNTYSWIQLAMNP